VEYREYQRPIFRGKRTDAQALEERSYQVFPRAHLDANENAKRVQWVVAQEQKAIENEINSRNRSSFP
jgi:hypothetical protein